MNNIQEYLNSIIKGDADSENKFFKEFLKKKTASIFNEQSLSLDFSDTILNIVNNNEKYSSEFKSLWTNNALTEQYSNLIKMIVEENDMGSDQEEDEVTKAVEELEVEGKKRKAKAKKKIVEAMGKLQKDTEFVVETEDSQGNERSWTIVAKTESDAEKEAASKHKKQYRTTPKTKVVSKK